MNARRTFLGFLLLLSFSLTIASQQVSAQDATAVGSVSVLPMYCPSNPVDTVIEGGIQEDCVVASGTFTFYLHGDGTDDYQQIVVNDGNNGIIELPSGTYTVIHEESQVSFDVFVPNGTSTSVVFSVSNSSAAVEWGRVYVDQYFCSDIEAAYWVDANAGLPAGLDCTRQAGVFTFTNTAGDPADHMTYETYPDLENFVDLTPGTYVVEHTLTHITTTITVPAFETTNIAFVMPTPAQERGSVTLASMSCTFPGTRGFEGTTGYLPNGCSMVEGDVFTFYLIGDGTDDYQQLTSINGVNSIALLPGSYELIHERTQTRTTVEVVGAADTALVYVEYAQASQQPTTQPTNAPTASAQPTKVPATSAQPTATAAAVTSLPSTGVGESSTLTMALAITVVGAALSLGIGLRLRNR